MKNLFYKTGLDITNAKECFEFLNNHFTYDTMNSWNGLSSIANNVKVYNLKLDGDCWNALTLLENDNYFNVNMMIEDWEIDHAGYKVGFNGRSGGYLVLYNEHGNRNVLPDELTGNYEYFKDYCKDYYGSIKNYMSTLKEYVRLVQDFDKLCDDIRYYVNELSKCDPVKCIVEDKLALFNDDYYDELKTFDLPIIELTEDNTIMISDAMRQHKSLVECLLHLLRNNAYDTTLKDNTIYIKSL